MAIGRITRRRYTHEWYGASKLRGRIALCMARYAAQHGFTAMVYLRSHLASGEPPVLDPDRYTASARG